MIELDGAPIDACSKIVNAFSASKDLYQVVVNGNMIYDTINGTGALPLPASDVAAACDTTLNPSSVTMHWYFGTPYAPPANSGGTGGSSGRRARARAPEPCFPMAPRSP
ncbi:MAG: hypothetical protein M9883_03940 [Methylobacteriaceae bacterium]|nr:hypothetical protein [Methylobacteriaceae bacterium]